jgi:hypothetical protein
MGMGTHRLIYSWEWELEKVPKSAALPLNANERAELHYGPENQPFIATCQSG